MVDLTSFLQDLRAKYAGINRPMQGLPADYAISGDQPPGGGSDGSPSILGRMVGGGTPAADGSSLSSQLSSPGQQSSNSQQPSEQSNNPYATESPQALGHMMTPMQAGMMRNEGGYGQVQGGYDPVAQDVTMRGMAGPQVSPMAGINYMANIDPFPMYKSTQPQGGYPHGLGAPAVSPTAGANAVAGGEAGAFEIKTGPDGMPIGPPPFVKPEHVQAIIKKMVPGGLTPELMMKFYPGIAGGMQKHIDGVYKNKAAIGALNQEIELAKKSGDPQRLATSIQRLRDFREGVKLKPGDDTPAEEAPGKSKSWGEWFGAGKAAPDAIDKVDAGPKSEARNEDATSTDPKKDEFLSVAREALAHSGDRDEIIRRLAEHGYDAGDL